MKKGFLPLKGLIVIFIIIAVGYAVFSYFRPSANGLNQLITLAKQLRQEQEGYYASNHKYAGSVSLLNPEFNQVCTPLYKGVNIWNCKDAYVDNLGTSKDPNAFVYISYCPGQGAAPDCADKSLVAVRVYFKHSSRPDQITCIGRSQKGNAFCKSLNLPKEVK